MGRTDLTRQPCPVARSRAVPGGCRAVLALRETAHGEARLDGSRRALGTTPNILAARLRGLAMVAPAQPGTDGAPLGHEDVVARPGPGAPRGSRRRALLAAAATTDQDTTDDA